MLDNSFFHLIIPGTSYIIITATVIVTLHADDHDLVLNAGHGPDIDAPEPEHVPLVMTSGSSSVSPFILNHHPPPLHLFLPLPPAIADHLSISHYKRNTDIDPTPLCCPFGY